MANFKGLAETPLDFLNPKWISFGNASHWHYYILHESRVAWETLSVETRGLMARNASSLAYVKDNLDRGF